jgi:hypothetical protein
MVINVTANAWARTHSKLKDALHPPEATPAPASAMDTDMYTMCGCRSEAWILAPMGKLRRMTTWKVGIPSLSTSFLLRIFFSLFPPSSFLLSFRPALPCNLPLLTVGSHASKLEPPTAPGNIAVYDLMPIPPMEGFLTRKQETGRVCVL